MIHVIRTCATEQEIEEMLEMLGSYIKLAVDIDRGVLAGGGALHADCEAILLEDGSKQEYIWGADWSPVTREVRYEALINIRPRQQNPSMVILDSEIRIRVHEIAMHLLGGQ